MFFVTLRLLENTFSAHRKELYKAPKTGRIRMSEVGFSVIFIISITDDYYAPAPNRRGH